MKKSTILRIIGKAENTGFHVMDNIANFEPRKNDHLVFKENCYIVLYVEYDFDKAVMYIVVEEN